MEFVVDSVASVALFALLHASEDGSEGKCGPEDSRIDVSIDDASLPKPSFALVLGSKKVPRISPRSVSEGF